MNKNKLFYFILIITLVFLTTISKTNAYTDNGSAFFCTNCTDCTNALNNNTYNHVYLNASITNYSGTSNCIDDPINFSNKVFDCQGYTIDGIGQSSIRAIYLTNKNNNTIKNCTITDFGYGIHFKNSVLNNMTNNIFQNINYTGVWLYNTSNNLINNNTFEDITHNSAPAVTLDWHSDNNTIANNTLNNVYRGIFIGWLSNNNIFTNNIIKNNNNHAFYLSNCNNNTFENNTINTTTSGGDGFYISYSNNNTIKVNTIMKEYIGISQDSSTYNTITQNTINNNTAQGIWVGSSSNNNNITNNTIRYNGGNGIDVYSSSNNLLRYNTVIYNGENGIYLWSGSNGNLVYTNILCSNNQKSGWYFDIYNQSGSNTGDNNTFCTSSNWIDSGETASHPMTYVCSSAGCVNSIILVSPANQTMTNDNTPSFSFNVTGSRSNYSCELFISGIGHGTNSTTLNNTLTTITSNSSLADGNYSWFIRCTGDCGLWNDSETRNISIDTVAPSISIISPLNTTYNNATILVNISSDGNTTWFSYNGGANETYTVSVYKTFSEGANTFYAYANDSAGNENSTSVVFTVDTTAPVLANISNSSITSSSVVITWDTNEASNSTVNYGTNSSNLSLSEVSATLSISHSITLNGLNSNTLYYYEVSSCDSLGNCNTSSQFNVTTSSASNGVISGGGSNKYKDSDYSSVIYKNQKGVFKFERYLAIRSINLTVKEIVHYPKIIIEWLDSSYDQKELPKFAEKPIYHYEKVDMLNFNDSLIKNIILKFRVKDSWIKENNIYINNIVLKRYNNGRWNDLKTWFIEDKDGYSYFNAESPGLSFFAIGIKKTSETKKEEKESSTAESKNETKPAADTKTQDTEPQNGGDMTTSKNEPSKKNPVKTKSKWVYWAIGAIIIGIAAALLTKKRSRKK